MEIFTRRSTKVGLFAVALAGLAAATTGMALAAESRPSVQLEICMEEEDGPLDMKVTGLNHNGDTITEVFSVEGCTILRKGETDYWWALGQDLETQIGSFQSDIALPDDENHDGNTLKYTLRTR